ncbi:hypothetical protein HJC23_005023 [Cyclotella cryptica]|uniref:HMA domain-containing protein n=1 Tax=Cyclotella cryptica TaxID=29204 RepID=A0ABD3QDY0_9STRA
MKKQLRSTTISMMHRPLLGIGLLFTTLAHGGNGATSLIQAYEVSRRGAISSSCCTSSRFSRRPRFLASAIRCRGLQCRGGNTGDNRSLLDRSSWELSMAQTANMNLLSNVSLALAFLPEAVYFWNKFLAYNFEQTDKSGNQPVLDDEAVSKLSSPYPVKATIVLDVPTMGCVACVNKVDSSIRSSAFSTKIRQERSWLTDGKGGIAELIVSGANSDEIYKIAEEVALAVGNAGFQCKVQSIQLNAD